MLKIFKYIALLEGISLLLLLFFAMPMKYFMEMPVFVQVIGMAHGILFLLYLMVAILIKSDRNWDTRTFLIICAASIVPFGTFYVEKKYLKA